MSTALTVTLSVFVSPLKWLECEAKQPPDAVRNSALKVESRQHLAISFAPWLSLFPCQNPLGIARIGFCGLSGKVSSSSLPDFRRAGKARPIRLASGDSFVTRFCPLKRCEDAVLVRGSCRKLPTSHTASTKLAQCLAHFGTAASRAEAKKAFDEDLGGLAIHSRASPLGSIGACLRLNQVNQMMQTMKVIRTVGPIKWVFLAARGSRQPHLEGGFPQKVQKPIV